MNNGDTETDYNLYGLDGIEISPEIDYNDIYEEPDYNVDEETDKEIDRKIAEETDKEIDRKIAEEVANIDFSLGESLGIVEENPVEEIDREVDEDIEDNFSLGASLGDLTDEEELLEVEEVNEVKEDETLVKFNANGDVIISETDLPFELGKEIPINEILIPKRVRKVSRESIQGMIRSIKANGLLVPIVITQKEVDEEDKTKYSLVDGYRRLLAYHTLGNKTVPCVINPNIRNTSSLLVEALYNHKQSYDIIEIIEFSKQLEDSGITNVNTIEYLLQMEIGDYTKLKDVLRDNDIDIIEKLKAGEIDIKGAYKKVEARRKKESKLQQQDKLSQGATGDVLQGVGNIGSQSSSVDDENSSSSLNDMNQSNSNSNDGLNDVENTLENLDNINGADLDEVTQEGEDLRLTKDNIQSSKNRERLDPDLREQVLSRDEYGCRCCRLIKGIPYKSVLDVHHIIPVYLNNQDKGISKDNMDNLVTLCTVCHKLVHEASQEKVHFNVTESTSEDEKDRITRVLALANIIKKGAKAKGLTIKDVKELDKGSSSIGRSLTGQIAD